MKSYECLQTVRKYPDYVQKILQSNSRNKDAPPLLHKTCSNKQKNITGYSWNELLIDPSQVISYKDICLTPVQMKMLVDQITPSPQKMDTNHPSIMMNLNLPLDLFLRPTVCPSHINPKPSYHDKRRLFLVCSFPIDWNQIPDKTNFKDIPQLNPYLLQHPLEWLTTLPIHYFDGLNSKFVYLFLFHKPIHKNPLFYDKHSIRSITLIGTQFVSLPPPLVQNRMGQNKKKIKSILSRYMSGASINMTKINIQQLSLLNIKLPIPMKAYRGIYVTFQDLQEFQWETLKVGDPIHYPVLPNRHVVSWTTDLCVAEYFATQRVMREIKDPFKFGIVFRCVLDPSQIIIDTRLLPIQDLLKIRIRSQMEILVDASSFLDKGHKKSCRVEQIWLIKDNYRIPVKDVAHLLSIDIVRKSVLSTAP